MKDLYSLEYIKNEDLDDEFYIFIGVYSSRKLAAQIMNKLKKQKEFSDHPKGFLIDKCFMNRDFWEDGYILW